MERPRVTTESLGTSSDEYNQVVTANTALHEANLRELLDPPIGVHNTQYGYGNYEYARDSGLLDSFYFNPETGEDGIVHTLAGDIVSDSDGTTVEVAGYHLESAAHHQDTFVDLEPLEGKNTKAMRAFRRYPFEPYSAHVVIRGYPKMVLQKKNGQAEYVGAHSSMFPEQYDPLAVLQAIRIAKETRDTAQDEAGTSSTIIAWGKAPMLDDKSFMDLQLILDAQTGKVITAFPTTKRGRIMDLQEEDIQEHLGLNN